MILLNDFYTILNRDASTGSVRAKISINRTHKIFDGHFPGLPIVPGVCMMQIIREIMEVTTDRPLSIAGAENMKFLSKPRTLEKNTVIDLNDYQKIHLLFEQKRLINCIF